MEVIRKARNTTSSGNEYDAAPADAHYRRLYPDHGDKSRLMTYNSAVSCGAFTRVN